MEVGLCGVRCGVTDFLEIEERKKKRKQKSNSPNYFEGNIFLNFFSKTEN